VPRENPLDITVILAILAVLCFIAAAMILYDAYVLKAYRSHQSATTARALCQIHPGTSYLRSSRS
jgi:hypothetical protein